MNDKTETRISLNDKDFRTLVSGGVVEQTDPKGNKARIILKDIGWAKMFELIYEAACDRLGNIKEKWENAPREAEETERSH